VSVTFSTHAPDSLQNCAGEFSKTRTILEYTLSGGTGQSGKKAFTKLEQKIEIDANVTLYSGTPQRLSKLLKDDGIIERNLFDHEEIFRNGGVVNPNMIIPVIYDKASKRLFFLYYYLGCGGQWKKTEGQVANIFVTALNNINPYLKSLSLGRNHRLAAASASATLHKKHKLDKASATVNKKRKLNKA
ncbi:MAG: hypothetical protein ACI90V_007551, partial [Bacillariaceae sp.]|jgi:hypothetical protein